MATVTTQKNDVKRFSPGETGLAYDALAEFWAQEHAHSEYGLPALRRAMQFVAEPRSVLDVGCGAGGRFVREYEALGLTVTGLDVSQAMLQIARQRHPKAQWLHASVTDWANPGSQQFDLIVAWDSLFHLPLPAHERVLLTLGEWLTPGGVMLYTFGDAVGEHIDTWRDREFYYSSLGIQQNLSLLARAGLVCCHLELDQWPLNHVHVIAQKREG